MIKEFEQLYFQRIEYFIFPTILFIVFCMRRIYKGSGIVSKIRGLVSSFLMSFMVLYLFHIIIFILLKTAFSRVIKGDLILILFYLVLMLSSLLFSYIFVQSIKLNNRLEKEFKQRPNFALFVYSQYMTIIYISMIFADNILTYNIVLIFLSLIWYAVFYNTFDIMLKIYPEKFLCETNISLLFEFMVVLMLWIFPQPIAATKTADQDVFFKWLSVLSILFYVFCVCSHKLIFSELYHRYKEFLNLSIDGVTGLKTRMYFIKEGEEFLEEAKKKGHDVAAVYINISRFKYYNQNYGIDFGDKLLRLIADYIKEAFPNETEIARLSYDHFAVLTEEVDSLDKMLEQFIDTIERESEFSLLVRIGVYVTKGKTESISEILDDATVACNRVKLEEGERIKYFDNEMLEVEKINLYVLQNIDRAIENELLKVYYQPIINVTDGKISSSEALVRWEDDNYGFLTPDKFIPILEEQNQIYKIDCFVLERICKDHEYVKSLGMKTYPVGFNISRKDFFAVDMLEFVEKNIQKYGLDRKDIKIEITESALVSSDKFIAKQIERFNSLGYKVFMDDFGSGYSSLNALGDFKFSGIKLDLVFLRNLSKMKRELMRGIVITAKGLGLEVLTEGVESEEHLEFLREIGCDNAQGYLFSKPRPLESYLEDKNWDSQGIVD